MNERTGKGADDARRTAIILMGVGVVLLILALTFAGFP
ncbi:hypothetical protein QO016_003433 [Methylobacterium persicinum]|uniref:Uncharacterized protein n=1 Tax=Methylobacterium persicinum TaxID=374426 RepID=A0ABU0HNM5_9HYPH|nr:hypothetical protein [Methylobacterium persicinum]GJE37617.1 hypothetical protein KHHGKMAE_1677 [Methylobacterium persicinum]